MLSFFGINVSIVIYYMFWTRKYESQHNHSFEFDAQNYDLYDFNIDLNINRIDRLFSIIQSKEDQFEKIFERLNVIRFKKLVDKSFYSDEKNWLFKFKDDIERNLVIERGEVGVTEKYVSELTDLSKNYSFNFLLKTFPSRKLFKVYYSLQK